MAEVLIDGSFNLNTVNLKVLAGQFSNSFLDTQNITIQEQGYNINSGVFFADVGSFNQFSQTALDSLIFLGNNLKMNSGQTKMTGGTVNAVFLAQNATGQNADFIAIADFSVKATIVQSAINTTSRTDDKSLVKKLFSGADQVFVDKGSFKGSLYGGKDEFYGAGGGDKVVLGGGNDTARSAGGADKLYGGKGADKLYGGAGKDVIKGGTGKDTLSGGAKADKFVFGKSDGVDKITDFGRGFDKISILKGAKSFKALDISQNGTTAVVKYANTEIRLQNTDADDLSASDFLF